MIEKAIKQQINNVFETFALRNDAIVLLCVDPQLEKKYVKPLLDSVINYVEAGSLCIMGDCSFNTNQSDIGSLQALTNRERLVLSADYPLQLLSLRQDCLLAKHPSISMGGVGKISKYIFRHSHLDFPYDKPSVFSDLDELNTLFVCVGNVFPKYALKHAYSLNSERIIKKESCVYDGKVISYLDFECDYKAIDALIDKHHLLEYNAEGPLDLYVGWYANILSSLRKSR